jgi:hypothetical protein
MDQLPWRKKPRASNSSGRVVFADLDEWHRKQNDLRNGLRLVERGLAGATAPRQFNKGAKRKAAQMAGRESTALGTSRQPAKSERGASVASSKDRENSETREDLPKAKS